jgi:biopolymer transport protein TolR
MGFGGGKQRGSISEINVTPLVDVMLVLLIVFMVTTPIIVDEMKQRSVEIMLPNTNAPVVTNDEIHTIIGIHADYRVTLDLGKGESLLAGCPGAAEGAPPAAAPAPADYEACLDGLQPKLENNEALADKSARVFLMADRALPYGYVVDVMARIRGAGLVNLGMVTNPPAGIGPAGAAAKP